MAGLLLALVVLGCVQTASVPVKEAQTPASPQPLVAEPQASETAIEPLTLEAGEPGIHPELAQTLEELDAIR